MRTIIREYGRNRLFVGGTFVGQTGSRRKIISMDRKNDTLTYIVIPHADNKRKYPPRTVPINSFSEWARAQGA